MNLDRANTEPFYRFHRLNEEINRSVKALIGGLVYVRETVESVRREAQPFILPNDGEPWGNRPWNSADSAVESSKVFVAQMAVVRHITSIEDFCLAVKDEYDRYCSVKKLSPPKADGILADEGFPPSKLYALLGWDVGVPTDVKPLYDYFEFARNCIVHRSGRASKALKQKAESAELSACLEGWHGSKNRKVHNLPIVEAKYDLPLKPRHSMLAAEVSRRIAIDVNKRLLSVIGVDGVVYMAAYHSMMSERPIETPARRFAHGTLNYVLTNRYRVGLDSGDEGAQVLRRLGRWNKYETRWRKATGERSCAVLKPLPQELSTSEWRGLVRQ